MRPADIQAIGNELAIRWEDGSEAYILLERLRRCCPCAACKGEVDIMGNLHKGPDAALDQKAYQLVRLGRVGGYGIQPQWADGHATGIYPFEYLRRIASNSGIE